MKFIECQPNDALQVPFAAKRVKELHKSICLTMENAKCKVSQFINNNVGRVEVLTDSPKLNRFVCSIFMRGPVFFAQLCARYRSNSTIFCISNCTNANWVCYVSLHREIIYLRLFQRVLERRLEVLHAKKKYFHQALEDELHQNETRNEMQDKIVSKNVLNRIKSFIAVLSATTRCPSAKFPFGKPNTCLRNRGISKISVLPLSCS